MSACLRHGGPLGCDAASTSSRCGGPRVARAGQCAAGRAAAAGLFPAWKRRIVGRNIRARAADKLSTAELMNELFGVGPMKGSKNPRPMISCVESYEGNGVMVVLEHPNGSSMVVSPYGAVVTKWVSSTGVPVLFAPPNATVEPGATFQGGAYPCFPQAGSAGPLPPGGFSALLDWEVVGTKVSPEWAEDPAPTVVLRASETPETLEIWPHKFQLEAQISLMETDDFPESLPWFPEEPELLAPGHPLREILEEGPSADAATKKKRKVRTPSGPGESQPGMEGVSEEVLVADMTLPVIPEQMRYRLTVTNSDEQPFTFTAAVCQHLTVLDTQSKFCRTLGFGGRHFIDYDDPMDPVLVGDYNDYTWFPEGDLQRLYINATEKVDMLLCPGDLTHLQSINRKGFRELALLTKGTSDPAFGRNYVCMNPGVYMLKVTLQPGQQWEGEVALRWMNEYWGASKDDGTDHPMPPRKTVMA